MRFRATTSQPAARFSGFTLVEMLLTTAIAAILVLSLTNVVNNTLAVSDDSRERSLLAREARFAMGRMVRAAYSALPETTSSGIITSLST